MSWKGKRFYVLGGVNHLRDDLNDILSILTFYVSLKTRWQNRTKSAWRRVLALGMSLHLLINLFLTSGLTYVSSLNYPGGHAIDRLHKLEANETGKEGISISPCSVTPICCF